MSSPSRYLTPSTSVAQIQNLIREATRTMSGLSLRGSDLDTARSMLETFLDDLAELPSSGTLTCQDCGARLPEYRVRRWYHPAPNAQVFDVLCRSCEATREDKEADAWQFAATTH